MTKLYLVGPDDGGEGVYSIIADTGEVLAQHYCSASGFAPGDLEGNRPARRAEWHKQFGDYEVLWLGKDDMTEERLLDLNRQWQRAWDEAHPDSAPLGAEEEASSAK